MGNNSDHKKYTVGYCYWCDYWSKTCKRKRCKHYKTYVKSYKRVEKYNSDDCNTDCAYAIEAIQGSFLEYLIDKCEKKVIYTKESVDYAIEALEEALDAVQNLEESK